MRTSPLTAPVRAWVESQARQTVAELLAEGIGQQLDSLTPQDERKFEEVMVDRELAMMADGIACERSYFRLALIRTARDSLLMQAEIRRLPSTTIGIRDPAPATQPDWERPGPRGRPHEGSV